MRRTSLLAALLAFGAGAAEAQSCVGLPPRGTVYAAVGFEGTDGRTGTSHTLALHLERTGIQVERERYTSIAGPHYTWDAQASHRLGDADAGERPTAVCAIAGASYASEPSYATTADFVDGNLNARYLRWRIPVGIAVGREMYFEQLALGVTPFVQPMVMLQRERLVIRGDRAPGPTHTRGAFAGLVGVGLALQPFVLRTSVGYAVLPESSLAGEHNWMVLSMQLGVAF